MTRLESDFRGMLVALFDVRDKCDRKGAASRAGRTTRRSPERPRIREIHPDGGQQVSRSGMSRRVIEIEDRDRVGERRHGVRDASQPPAFGVPDRDSGARSQASGKARVVAQRQVSDQSDAFRRTLKRGGDLRRVSQSNQRVGPIQPAGGEAVAKDRNRRSAGRCASLERDRSRSTPRGWRLGGPTQERDAALHEHRGLGVDRSDFVRVEGHYEMNPAFLNAAIDDEVMLSTSSIAASSRLVKLKHVVPCMRALSSFDISDCTAGFATPIRW